MSATRDTGAGAQSLTAAHVVGSGFGQEPLRGRIEALRSLGARQGWKLEVFHDPENAPSGDDPVARSLVGTGIPRTEDHGILDDDFAFLSARMPERVQAVLSTLASDWGVDAPEKAPAVREGMHIARQVAARSIDFLVSTQIDPNGLASTIAAAILDRPHVLLLSENSRCDLEVGPSNLVLSASRVGRTTDALPPALTTLIDSAKDWLHVASMAETSGRGPVAELGRRPLEQDLEVFGPAALGGPLAATPVDPSKAQPILILATERTGSNLLSTRLAQHREVGMAQELFNIRMTADDRLAWIGSVDVDLSERIALRREDPAAFLHQLIDDATEAGIRHVGFKLQYQHALCDHRVLPAIAALPGLRVIHLRRRQRLRQFLSLQRAVVSDRWWSKKTGAGRRAPKTAGEPLDLDIARGLRHFRYLELSESRFAEAFDLARVPLLDLGYEQLMQDPPARMAQAQIFLGLSEDHSVGVFEPARSRSLADELANYDEWVAALTGTRWEELLERSA